MRWQGMAAMLGMLTLAACSGQEPASVDANIVDEMGGNVSTPAPAPTLPEPVVNSAAAAPEEAGVIPAAYRGRWGMGPNDCDPGRDDAKGLMDVEPRRLTFYEARATVKNLRTEAEDRAVLDLAFSGEGQEWTTETSLRLDDGGKRLIRTDKGWENGTFRYERCAG